MNEATRAVDEQPYLLLRCTNEHPELDGWMYYEVIDIDPREPPEMLAIYRKKPCHHCSDVMTCSPLMWRSVEVAV